MDKAEQYLLHSAGIYAMLAWLEEQKQSGTSAKVNKQTIFIHPLSSRFFSIGVSKNPKLSKNPFLAIQPNESSWIKLIQWDKICIIDRDMHLYLVSKTILGDNSEYPDIPAFSFAISFDAIEKLDLLSKISQLDGREYRQENGKVMINFNSKIFSQIKIQYIKKEENYLIDNDHVVNYGDLLTSKEQNLQKTYSDGVPEFKGDGREASSIAERYWKPLKELLDGTKK